MTEAFYEKFSLLETEYGVELTINDTERAGEFDDFINEKCFIKTSLRPVDDGMTFLFGQASCMEKVNALIEKFKQTVPFKQK
jgi:hypothetical protein